MCQTQKIRVAIVGTGAMASFFTARLSPFCQLSIIGSWPEQLQALQKGITIIENGHQKTLNHFQVYHCSKAPKHHYDWVIILLKQWQSNKRIEEALELLNKSSTIATVFSLQNGWQHQAFIQQLLPKHQICFGTTTQGAKIAAPGLVVNAGNGITTFQNHLPQPTKILLTHLFEQAKLNIRWENNLEFLLAKKLMINAVINPLSVLFNQQNGGLLLAKTPRALLFSLTKEVFYILASHELKGMSMANAQSNIIEVIVSTRVNRSSMLTDIYRGNPTEVEAILGHIIQLAAIRQRAAPLCNWLLIFVKNKVQKAPSV